MAMGRRMPVTNLKTILNVELRGLRRNSLPQIKLNKNNYRRNLFSMCESYHMVLKESVRRFSSSVDSSAIERQNPQNQITMMKEVEAIFEEKYIKITWEDESQNRRVFPFVWLRDNCQCHQCFHPVSLSRTMLFSDLQLEVTPVEMKVINHGSTLEIKWSDGHISQYNAEWLQERGFDQDQNQLKRPSAYKLNKIFWDSEIVQHLPMANFDELMEDDGSLLAWLRQLEVFGFVLINNAPAEYGNVGRLVERVAFIKKTHYGAEFSVTAKPDPSNVAYSNGPLQLHTDLPYYEYKPGVQLIHCIVQFQGPGGESQLADAAHVANQLKKTDPEMFKVLSETYVDWCDRGSDEGREFLKILRRPVICLDNEGNIERINFSHPQRDSFLNVELQTVFKWYQAMKIFHKMLYDPRYCLEFKMTPGTIQSFDNMRIVHGRRSYEVGAGERKIEGCYMDWDEVKSKRRVLEKKLNFSSDQ